MKKVIRMLLSALMFLSTIQVLWPMNQDTPRSAIFQEFARSIQSFDMDPTTQKMGYVVSLLIKITDPKEKEDAGTILQGILSQYKSDHPIYQTADKALRVIHQIKAEQVIDDMQGINTIYKRLETNFAKRTTQVENETAMLQDNEKQIMSLAAEVNALKETHDVLNHEVRNMQATERAGNLEELEKENKELANEIRNLTQK